MDVGPKLKWCTFVAVGAVTLGVVCADLSRRRRKKASSRPTVCEVPREEEMAATIENECPSEPISQLASTMKQLKVSAVDASPIHCSQTGREDSSDSFIPDRDSANHSPDFLSGNLHSDSHSESSTDSGKGGSDCAHANHASSRFDSITPPMSPVIIHHHHLHSHLQGESTADPTQLLPLPERLFVYEFEIHQQLVGLIIGKFGAYVNYIKAQTGASLLIKDHNKRYKLCAIEGTKSEIDAALVLLREKFPPKRYPMVTLAQINVAPEPALQQVLPDSIQLVLPPEVSCDVMVSAYVTPNHVFVQQISHPTFPSLTRLDHCMAQCYNEFPTPVLPQPIEPSMICAAPSLTDAGWYRAKIVAVYPPASSSSVTNQCAVDGVEGAIYNENGTPSEENLHQEEQVINEEEDFEVDVCYVDYGGYSRLPASCLRQIRTDFMSLPFQAIECLLANVGPTSDDGWSTEAYEELENLTRERMLQAQAMAYSLEGIPLVYLFQMDPTADEALINRQLVNRGVAQWVEPNLPSN